MNHEGGKELWEFTSDPTGGDGIFYSTDEKRGYPTEHVMVASWRDDDATEDLEALILKQSQGQ